MSNSPSTVPDIALFEAEVRYLFPHMPEKDVHHVCCTYRNYPKSVGRRSWVRARAWYAVESYARHQYTSYDTMIVSGLDPDFCRQVCHASWQKCIDTWTGGVKRVINNEKRKRLLKDLENNAHHQTKSEELGSPQGSHS